MRCRLCNTELDPKSREDDIKIYIAIWEDRHFDVSVHPFYDREIAITWAKNQVNDNKRISGDTNQPLTNVMKKDGWIYLGIYSCEGDSIRIVETKIMKEDLR